MRLRTCSITQSRPGFELSSIRFRASAPSPSRRSLQGGRALRRCQSSLAPASGLAASHRRRGEHPRSAMGQRAPSGHAARPLAFDPFNRLLPLDPRIPEKGIQCGLVAHRLGEADATNALSRYDGTGAALRGRAVGMRLSVRDATDSGAGLDPSRCRARRQPPYAV